MIYLLVFIMTGIERQNDFRDDKDDDIREKCF